VNKTISIAIVAAIFSLIGCNETRSGSVSDEKPAPAGASGQTAIKRYPMHGKVVSVNTAEKSAKIDAGPIGDWMGAMTMNYAIKDDADFAKLTPGITFDATVFVNGDDFWVGEVKPAQ
jgi:Cu/Ag efflux protein CusF